MDVFDRMEKAYGNGLGVELSHADLELMYDLLGEKLGKAKDDIDQWRERFADYERAAARAQQNS